MGSLEESASAGTVAARVYCRVGSLEVDGLNELAAITVYCRVGSLEALIATLLHL